MIPFKTISASKRTPGVDTEVSLSGGSVPLSGTHQKCMLAGQRMSAQISVPSFTSGTLNDCILGTNAAYVGTVLRKIIVQITTAAATDIFKWSNDGGSTWTVDVNCATANTALAEGVTIKFGAITGHAVGDQWTFFAFPAGTVAEKVPTNVLVVEDAAAYFGAGSVLYRMVKACLATAKMYGTIDLNCVAMNDAAGQAATGSVALAGTATGVGSARINIGNDYVEVGFAIGDTAAAIALALKTELDKIYDELPVMFNRVAGALGTILFTSKNLGTCGNDVNLAVELTPALGITVVVTAMNGGATDPANLDDALDACMGQRYHVVASQLADSANLTTFTAYLDSVSNSGIEKYAIGTVGTNNATLSAVTTLARAANSYRLLFNYLRGSLSAGYEIAAVFAAVKTYVEDVSLPLNGLQLFGLHVPSVQGRLSEAAGEIEACLQNCVSPLTVDEDGRVAIVRAITTYICDDDERLLDVNVITGWDYYRYAWRNRMKTVFNQAKNLPKTPDAVNTQSISVACDCEEQEMGVCDVAQYLDKFKSEKDANNSTRVNSIVPSPIIPGLQRICAVFNLYF